MSQQTRNFCCFELRTSGIILGVLDILVRAIDIFATYRSPDKLSLQHSYHNPWERSGIQTPRTDLYFQIYGQVRSVDIRFQSCCVFISCLWLVGIFLRKRWLMLPALVMWFLHVILFIALAIATPFIPQAKLVLLFIFGLVSALLLYFWIIEYAVFKSMAGDGRDTQSKYEPENEV